MNCHHLIFAAAIFAIVTSPPGARAGLIGDAVDGDLRTVAAGSFDTATATVGDGIEFSKSNNNLGTGVTLDLADSSFTFTLYNNYTGNPDNPGGLYNLGLEGFDWTDNAAEIISVVLVSSTFPVDAITGSAFDTHSVHVDFNQPIIPGFGTVWTATWDVTTAGPAAVPEPGSISLIALGACALIRRALN